MIKRIIIPTLLYFSIILTLTLNMEKLGNSFIYYILILSFIFSIFIISVFYKKNLKNFKPKNNVVEYSKVVNLNTQLNKISTRPFLFGLERKLISDDELFFDNEHFYAINNEKQIATFKLIDITEISKTSLTINNRRLWQVKIIQDNNKEIVFKFAHNYTIWNRNFALFYDKIKEINPNAVKSKWNIFNI